MTEQMWSASIGAFATLAAAGIGGLFSFLASVLSKEQKTSEFRQLWIDGLREDLANIAAYAGAISVINMQKYTEQELNAHRKEALVQISLANAKLLLRLNPDEPISRRISSHLREISQRLGGGDPEKSGLNRSISEFVSDGQKLLKSEWKRVKRGEITFQIVKWSSLAIFSSFILFTIWTAI